MSSTSLTCLRVFIASLVLGPAVASGGDLTTMPHELPANPAEYLNKWDPFVLKPLAGVQQSLSRNNGRQIVRDSAGRCFLLIEKDQKALYLGMAVGPRAVGGDVQWLELIGPSPQAVFSAAGPVVAGSMVLDRGDRLHVVWSQSGALRYTSRNMKGVSFDRLRQKVGWKPPQTLADAPCDLGDVMLDASGKATVCYSRQDSVYYLPIGGKPEIAAASADMPPLSGIEEFQKAMAARTDTAAPGLQTPVKSGSGAGENPPAANPFQSCEAVMDLAPDGSIHLAFRRDFEIWYARRTGEGKWLPPERAAWSLAFHPAILVADDRPLICFQYEGAHKATAGGDDYLAKREGGGASIGYAIRTARGWRTDYVAKAEEVVVNRQGIWIDRFRGKLLPMVEEMWRPVLFRDRHGVAWAFWQNTTRRWAYCARWLGDGFGVVQECRGPFCAPGQPVSAEKLVPKDAADVGLLLIAANRVIFDRMKVPSLSLAEDREVLFLDSWEVAETHGLQFAVNQMTKHPDNPVLSPGPPGSKDDRFAFDGVVCKHGDKYVMAYQCRSWASPAYGRGYALSADGVHWRKVEELPAGIPPPDDDRFDTPFGSPQDPVDRGYFDNPDRSDPAKRFMKVDCFGGNWATGSRRVRYSFDGKHWADGPEVTIVKGIFEAGLPNLWDTLDAPQRRIKIYGRVYSTNSRSCGMIWSSDLLYWHGLEHYLDPDDPYGKPPGHPNQGALRGQIFLDACAGKNEDQIYQSYVRIVDGLYLCLYWPCSFEHRYEGALAVSRDGYNFTRVKNGSRTLPVGPAGEWDSGIVKTLWPQRDGDILRLYYGGSSYHHGVEPYHPDWHLGLATIRVNGWTYYTPTSDGRRGSLTTIPIDAPPGASKSLTVNVEGTASSSAALRVEILDAATGQALAGFTANDCKTIAADGLSVPVAWTGGAAIPSGKPIRLRFVMSGRDVRLYSFRFK